MPLNEDLTAKVAEFATHGWGEIPNGYVVPDPDSLTFGNTGIRIDACVLYADIHGSTDMVDALPDTKAAEYYKAFLHCGAKIIKENDGTITAYDGDRIMAIFMGEDQAERSVRTAFHITYAVRSIINPQFDMFYLGTSRMIKHTVGIDCGTLLAAKAGVRDDRDLVWVGPAANYAAKLNSFDGLDPTYQTRITTAVHEKLNGALCKTNAGEEVWDGPYNNFPAHKHYRSLSYMKF